MLLKTRDIDCVVKSTDFMGAYVNVAGGPVVRKLSGGTLSPYMDPDEPLVQLGYYYEMDYNIIFTAKGTACPDNNFYFNIYAKLSDGQKLNPDYLSFTIPKDSSFI